MAMTHVAQGGTDVYLAAFDDVLKRSGKDEPDWLTGRRRSGMDRFMQLGFPTTRQEDWRFTNVAPIADIPFAPAEDRRSRVIPAALQQFTFGRWECHQLVFLNGQYSPELSSVGVLPKGVLIGGLNQALAGYSDVMEPHLGRCAEYQDQPFVALNTAFMSDGAFIFIPKGVLLESPIHLLFLSAARDRPIVSHPRNLIIADTNSQMKIVESYGGLEGGVSFTNAVTEIVAGENAAIDHYKLQRESVDAFHVATLQAIQMRSSQFSTHTVSLGGALVRNDVNVVLAGEGCQCVLNGSYMVKGHQHVDNHTVIDHVKPHGSSRELYKGILDDHATGVFNGRVIVRPGAQQTDARQTNKNLLLSEDALVNTNPQLEIYADDVKCTHGATIGQLEADALFYLRSRGIDLETARHLLTYAFASDMIRRINIEAIRTGLECTMFMSVPQGHTILEDL